MFLDVLHSAFEICIGLGEFERNNLSFFALVDVVFVESKAKTNIIWKNIEDKNTLTVLYREWSYTPFVVSTDSENLKMDEFWQA